MPTETRDYAKDRLDHVDFEKAVELAKSGWVIARDEWKNQAVVFYARSGTFVAADLVSGDLLPFFVLRNAYGEYQPWFPRSEDMHTTDWIALSRQTYQRTTPSMAEPASRGILREAPRVRTTINDYEPGKLLDRQPGDE
jgi:hypothetical protein